ncbi:hypothetical protein KKH23_04980 [Patescibacteria group bacterium]|nr:hypothetical protein [Patescibacteria group bacterium]MBU1067236.1 hypothetical protein [Patescibacteria group bacterium]
MKKDLEKLDVARARVGEVFDSDSIDNTLKAIRDMLVELAERVKTLEKDLCG